MGFMGFKKTRQRRAKKSVAWYDKKYSPLQVAQKALAGVKYIKGMINCEKKYRDTQWTGSADYNGSIQCISYCATGDDVDNRQGNSILVRSMYIRADIQANAAATNTYFRIIVFMDKENQGTDPTASDVLATVGSSYAPTSPLNVDHIARYTILVDKTITMDAVKSITSSFVKYIPLQHHLKYTGTAAANIYKNAVYMLMLSNQVTTNLPAFQLTARMGFYDN